MAPYAGGQVKPAYIQDEPLLETLRYMEMSGAHLYSFPPFEHLSICQLRFCTVCAFSKFFLEFELLNAHSVLLKDSTV